MEINNLPNNGGMNKESMFRCIQHNALAYKWNYISFYKTDATEDHHFSKLSQNPQDNFITSSLFWFLNATKYINSCNMYKKHERKPKFLGD